jgi:hypothetical protein
MCGTSERESETLPAAIDADVNHENATAISPLAMNAAGRVNSPIMIRNPPTVSMTPARLGPDMSGDGLPAEPAHRLLQPIEEEQQSEDNPEQRVGIRGVALWNHEAS